MRTVDEEFLADSKRTGVHPKTFLLWVFMVSITMMFAAMTSAYLVQRGEGKWLVFDVPTMFSVSTAVILLSSVSAQWSLISIKKDNLGNVKTALGITFLLGLVFLFVQVKGWGVLVDQGIYFAGEASNAGGSFFYVLSGMHGFHILSGLVFLSITIVKVFRLKVHSQHYRPLELCVVYWHYLGFLWVYLFGFMLYFR